MIPRQREGWRHRHPIEGHKEPWTKKPTQHRGRAPARTNESKSIGPGYSRPGCTRAVPAVMKMPPGGSRSVPFILCGSCDQQRMGPARSESRASATAHAAASKIGGQPNRLPRGLCKFDASWREGTFFDFCWHFRGCRVSLARGRHPQLVPRNHLHLFFIINLYEYPLLNLAHLTSPLFCLPRISPSSSSHFISVQGSSFNFSSQQLVACSI